MSCIWLCLTNHLRGNRVCCLEPCCSSSFVHVSLVAFVCALLSLFLFNAVFLGADMAATTSLGPVTSTVLFTPSKGAYGLVGEPSILPDPVLLAENGIRQIEFCSRYLVPLEA